MKFVLFSAHEICNQIKSNNYKVIPIFVKGSGFYQSINSYDSFIGKSSTIEAIKFFKHNKAESHNNNRPTSYYI